MTASYFFFIFGNVFQFAVILFAFWKGGREERIVGAALLANIIASKVSLASHWSEPEWAVLAVDVLLLAVMLTLALRTSRWWLMWCTAFQLVIAVTHLAIVADDALLAPAYRASTIIWTYMVLFALLAGTWGHWTRRRLAGPR